MFPFCSCLRAGEWVSDTFIISGRHHLCPHDTNKTHRRDNQAKPINQLQLPTTKKEKNSYGSYMYDTLGRSFVKSYLLPYYKEADGEKTC